MTFALHKEIFFWVLGKLLREGKIAFDDPYGEPWTYDPYSSDPNRPEQDEAHLWKAEPEEIIAYLQKRWPKDANDEHDLELNYYFYEMPYILWSGEDGRWYGS